MRRRDVVLRLEGDKLGCSAPPGVLTAELKSELQRRKPEIIDWLTHERRPSGHTADVPFLDREQPLPVTPAQARLWFIHQLEPDRPTYHVTCALRLTGSFHPDVATEAMRAIVARHESLRTSFTSIAGQPAAVVHASVACQVRVVDLTDRGGADPEAEAKEFLEAAAREPFDLRVAPLCRTVIVRVTPELHFIGVTLHHIVVDGWSVAILLSELLRVYRATLAGTPAALPTLPMQFVDYVAWQQKWLARPGLDEQLAWWREQLAAPLGVIDLPTDHVRPRRPSSNGARMRRQLPDELSARLRAFARAERTTLFAVMLAAFKLLLQRYSGQEDLIVGTATAGRRRPDAEPLVGMFVDTLVIRTKLDDNPTVRAFIRRVFGVFVQAAAHGDVPFDRLVGLVNHSRDLAHDPLAQVMFTLQNFPPPEGVEDVLTAEPVNFHLGTARLDLSVDVGDFVQGGAMEVAFEYRTDLFREDTIVRMQQHYQCLLEAMVECPDACVRELPMLTPDDTAWLASRAGDSRTEYPHDRVEAVIGSALAGTPDRIAVRAHDGSLSCAELLAGADVLARHLHANGIGHGHLVGVFVARGRAMPVVLLAILRAGAAYLPIDPTCPPDRLRFVLADAGAVAVVTDAHMKGRLGQPEVLLVDIDETAALNAPPAGQVPTSPREAGTSTLHSGTADDLAYVIYTSGSTGRPKGVEITHRALVNFLWSMRARPGLTGADRLLAVTTLSFDIAGLEMFLPLMVGAELVVATRTQAADGVSLAQLLAEADITVMQATPTTWRILVDAGWRPRPGFKVLCGGEALPMALARRLLEQGCELWNLYGPTETTIWSTVEQVRSVDEPISIGTPIANTQVVVLDRAGQQTAIGVPGELCIGGDGLARGYRGRPELTAERFIVHDGQRLYRTGDLARWRSDGRLEHLGRLDRQVKIRGFRIELGEIESTLDAQPGVRQSVVVARQHQGRQQLIAYVVPASGHRLEAPTLRAALARALPDYMIPAAFIALEAMPLGTTGKVDVAALPAPDVEPPTGEPAPLRGNAVELGVAEVWRELLGTSGFSLHDNFYDAGGHSLLVPQLQHKLRDRFGCEISLVDLFERPTVATIAAFIQASGAALSAASHAR